MNYDITGIIQNWDYDPSGVTARYIDGNDGRRKIQLRLDMGLFQMELDGRPDGTRPREHSTLLDFYRTQANTTRKPSLGLDGEACTELQQESVQFYYRYLANYALKDYEGVIRDTRHNLEIFDFVSRHAEDEDLSWDFIQYKPYVLMMNARAQAEAAAAREDFDAAVQAARKGHQEIKAFWEQQGEDELMKESYEVETLKDLAKSFKERRPHNEADTLREKLAYAIRIENYEKAAKLRDKIQEMDPVKSEPAPATP